MSSSHRARVSAHKAKVSDIERAEKTSGTLLENIEWLREALGNTVLIDTANRIAAELAKARIPHLIVGGLAVQEHPAAFAAIKYSSRFLDQPCLAMFDRDELPGKFSVKGLGSLSSLDAAAVWLDERKAALV